MFRLSFAEAIQLVNRTEYLHSRIKHGILHTAKNKRAVFTPLLCNICMEHTPHTLDISIPSFLYSRIYVSVYVYMCINTYTDVMRLPRAAITLRCVIRAQSFSCLSPNRVLFHSLFSRMRNSLYAPIIVMASRQNRGTHNHNDAVAKNQRPDQDSFIKRTSRSSL